MPINPHYTDNSKKFFDDKPRPDAPRPGDFPEGDPQPDDNPQKDNPYAKDRPKEEGDESCSCPGKCSPPVNEA